MVLTDDPNPNDTYAGQNNDVDSPMKTFARFLQSPQKVKAGQAAAITGVAQVGAAGLSKVQYCLLPKDQPLPARDPYLLELIGTMRKSCLRRNTGAAACTRVVCRPSPASSTPTVDRWRGRCVTPSCIGRRC